MEPVSFLLYYSTKPLYDRFGQVHMVFVNAVHLPSASLLIRKAGRPASSILPCVRSTW